MVAPSIGVHVECHDPKGLSKRYYNFDDRHLPSAKYVNLFNQLQQRLEQDVSAETGVKISVKLNPGPGPAFPSSSSSARLEGAEEGWFLRRRKAQQDDGMTRVRYPRLGAFEVVVVDPVGLGPLTTHFKAFSKIGTRKWPQVDALCKRLTQVLNAAQNVDAKEVQRLTQRMQQLSEGCEDPSRCASTASTAPHKQPFPSGVNPGGAKHSGKATPAEILKPRPAGRPGTAASRPRPPTGAGFAGFPAPARPASAGCPLRPAGAAPPWARSAAEPGGAAAAPRQQVLQIESLGGYWRSASPPDSVLVESGRVKWASRPSLQPWTLKAFSHERVVLTGASDEKCRGTLRGGSLVWDDGDVWVRHEQAGRTMTPECAPPIQAADRAFNAQEVDSTAPAKERRLFPLRATDDCSRLLVEKGRATSGQTPVLEDLVGRLVNKHGKSGRPRDIVSQLRNLPTLEEQLDKGRFKAPLYSLGVMTDTPLNLNELFAELSRGNPPTCSMSMLIEALHARWPTVDPLPSATAGRGREHSSDCSSSRDASVSSASSAGRRRRRLGQQAGPALQEKAEARLAENVKDDAYSDDDFETEEAEPAQHLEEPSVILPAAKPASQAALRCPSTRDDGSDEHEADEDGYADGDFEDDEASRVEKDESDDDVLGESEDVLDESEHQDLLDQSEHQDDDDVLDESEHQDVPDQSGDEGAHRPARAALAAVPDEVGSEGSERDQERSDIESVASG